MTPSIEEEARGCLIRCRVYEKTKDRTGSITQHSTMREATAGATAGATEVTAARDPPAAGSAGVTKP